MNEPMNQQFPHNKPYIEGGQNQEESPKPSRKKGAESTNNYSPTTMSASALAERVQYLQEQLILISNSVNEENRSWQEQMMTENNKLTELLDERDKQIEELKDELKQKQAETKLLKDNLFKQNEEMQTLHKELQESRLQSSKIQRTNSPQLQEKVLQLNDEISTLLVKIQQLIQENNQQLNYIQELQKAVRQLKKTQEASKTEIQRLNDQNYYLKEEIKQVQNLSMSQQKQSQNRLLQELEETKVQRDRLRRQSEIGAKKQEEKQVILQKVQKESKDINSLRAEVHSLEEQIIQQRDIQRSLRKKYQERLRAAEDEVSSRNEEISKLKQKNRQLENLCSDHLFSIEQLQKEKNRENSSRYGSTDSEHFRNIIVRLEAEKEEMNMKLIRLQAHQRHETSTQFYSSAISQAEGKVRILRQQLSLAEQQLANSRRSSKEAADLARHWEQDYGRLAKEYQEVLQSRSNFKQKMFIDQLQLQKHKDIYEQLVKKYDQFQGMYKDLQIQVKILEEQKGRPISSDQQSRIIKEENILLKKEIQQLKSRVEQLSYQILQKDQKPDRLLKTELERSKSRQKELQGLIENLRNRLITDSQAKKCSSSFLQKEFNDQLTRVNKMLNQKEMQLDSMKQKYEDLHAQFNKKDSLNILPKHHPELTKLKSEYVALQRKLMEKQLSAKNDLQNADYQIQALKIQNSHHRKKIDQLLKELTSERISNDYRNLIHSLQLSEERNRQLERQVDHCQIKIKDLCDQLRRPSSRDRKRSDSRSSHHDYQIRINENSPRMPSIITHSRTIEQSQKKHESPRLLETFHPSNTPLIEKENQSSSSIYEQLVKERLELKAARSEFESKWGSISGNEPNFFKKREGL